MKIIDNRNLIYTSIPGGTIGPRDEFEMDIKKMFLFHVERETTQTLRLDLKTEKGNEKKAWIRAKNAMGEKDLNFLGQELKDKFINRSYDEILNTDFKKLASRIPFSEI